MTPDNQDETLSFLAVHRLPYVCADIPRGHSSKWDSRDIHERFGYRYTDAELAEWTPKVRALARDAEQTHVLFNSCYRDYAQADAQQLAALLHS